MAVDGCSADIERLGDFGDGSAGSQEGAGGFGALGCPDGGAAEAGSSGLGSFQAGDGSLDGELALERGERGDEVDHESAGGGCCVDGLVEAAKVDGSPGEVVDGGHEVWERASEAVEAPHDEGVALVELGQRLVEAGAGGQGT